MAHLIRTVSTITALVLSTLCHAENLATPQQLIAEADAIAAQFVGRLKPQLKAAMLSGGPTAAISICADVAPTIAWKLSWESGWLVRRVSLKPRNTSTAVADTWEAAQLQAFDHVAAQGESPGTQSAWVEGEFRYVKPQLVEGLCLACHGEQLAPEVNDALALYYSEDRATGYKLGQVRGAISLRWTPRRGTDTRH